MNQPTLTLYKNGEQQPRELPFPPGRPGEYLEAFLREIRGQREGLHLSSAESLHAARTSLLLQEVSDQGTAYVPVPY